MWSIFFISTLLAIHLPSLYGDVSHIVNNKHPGYGHHKPDQPLEYPAKGTNTHETHAGYPKVVPDNQLQLTSNSNSNSQTQYPDGGDSITAGANSGGVITNLQTDTTGGHQHQHHHNHGADGKYDPHDDGTGWDIRKSVPGEPEQDYPTYATVPRTAFTCAEKVPGYYADIESRCQAFRICTTRSTNSFTSFLCPNGTIFNQAQLTCDWWNNVNCEHSNQYYYKNNEIGQMPEGAQLMYMIHKMLEAPGKQSYYNGGKIADSQEQGTGAVQQGIYLPPQTPVVYTTQQPLTSKQPYTFDHNQYAQTTTVKPIHSVVQTDTSSGGYQFQQQNTGSHSTVQADSLSGGYQYQQPQLTLQEIQFAEQQEILRKQQLYEQKLSTQKAQELAIKNADEEARKQADLYQQSLQNVQRPVPQDNSNEQLKHDLQQNIQQSLLEEQQQTQHNLQDNVISNYSPARPEYNQIDYANVQQQKVGETTESSFTSTPILYVSTLAPETTPLIPIISNVSPEVSDSFETTDNSDSQGTLFLSTLAPSTATPDEKEPPKVLHVSQVVEPMDPQPLFVSEEKPQLFTSQVGNQLYISNTISKEENKSTNINNHNQFDSQLTTIHNPQPLFVSPVVTIGSESSNDKKDNNMLFISPIVSPILPMIPGVPTAPNQTLYESTIISHSTTSDTSPQVQPAVTFTKENTQTVTHSEKTTHTIHGSQSSDLGKGPEKISLVDKQPPSVPVPKPVVPQIPQIHETQYIPSYQTAHTSFQTDGYHQVPEKAIHAINQLASAQQSVASKVDNSKFGHGLIDVRGKDQNPIMQNHQQSVDFPSFSSESFKSFQGYPFPSETPSFHFDNFHHINSHLKSDNQRVNYEFSNDRTANNYQGQGVTNFGSGNSHHTYSGQNLGFKQTTRVEILPAIGFEISDPVGRNNFQSALQNGLFKDTGYQASQTQFHPSDVRYSSYLGPSSYLVPQMSVQQLPSDSGIHY